MPVKYSLVKFSHNILIFVARVSNKNHTYGIRATRTYIIILFNASYKIFACLIFVGKGLRYCNLIRPSILIYIPVYIPVIIISLLQFYLDVNECLSERHDCDVNADCINTEGGYNCSCREGFMGNGTHCSGIINTRKMVIIMRGEPSLMASGVTNLKLIPQTLPPYCMSFRCNSGL